MTTLTLLKQGSPLSDPATQLALLSPKPSHKRFGDAIADQGMAPLRASAIAVLQVNVGKLCNQTCRHCHVDAGPSRREIMNRETMEDCLRFLEHSNVGVLDITGGAPEMNPDFRWFVECARQLGRHVIDRCNLTILEAHGFEDLAGFLAREQVEIVASLPCYSATNVNAQRGDGVFEKSISALRRLNELGYARAGGDLILNLVYNPLGPSLPPPQEQLEEAYHQHLAERFGVVFNRLYTITNMPISRFLADLVAQSKLDEYMQRLIESFNPAAVAGLMCRSTLSVGWDGRLYDCDFNQMLEMGLAPDRPQTIHEAVLKELVERPIAVGQHCFGCTAGAGSGCQGAILDSRDQQPQST